MPSIRLIIAVLQFAADKDVQEQPWIDYAVLWNDERSEGRRLEDETMVRECVKWCIGEGYLIESLIASPDVDIVSSGAITKPGKYFLQSQSPYDRLYVSLGMEEQLFLNGLIIKARVRERYGNIPDHYPEEPQNQRMLDNIHARASQYGLTFNDIMEDIESRYYLTAEMNEAVDRLRQLSP